MEQAVKDLVIKRLVTEEEAVARMAKPSDF
jgi:hypothetical protein